MIACFSVICLLLCDCLLLCGSKSNPSSCSVCLLALWFTSWREGLGHYSVFLCVYYSVANQIAVVCHMMIASLRQCSQSNCSILSHDHYRTVWPNQIAWYLYPVVSYLLIGWRPCCCLSFCFWEPVASAEIQTLLAEWKAVRLVVSGNQSQTPSLVSRPHLSWALFPKSCKDQWDCEIGNYYVALSLWQWKILISTRVSVPFLNRFGIKCLTLLGDTVTKVCTSPRNLTWLSRSFLLVRGWGLGTTSALCNWRHYLT